jgi:hypothetical protein
MVGRRSFVIGMIIILSFEDFIIFSYFSTRFYIGGPSSGFSSSSTLSESIWQLMGPARLNKDLIRKNKFIGCKH